MPPLQLPVIFGILNITPDSFSDGGCFLEPQAALKQAAVLEQGGAQVIDLGAASSHPDSQKVSAEEELSRLRPVFDKLIKKNHKISVDSHQKEVQRYALQKGVDYLNDTSAFPDPSFYTELADAECKLILMHSIQQSGSATRQMSQTHRIYTQMLKFFEDRLEKLIQKGIRKKRLILDPGMGFFLGSNPESSLHILTKLKDIKEYFKLPLMVSVSRKSFLGALTQKPTSKRGPSTLAAELFAWEMGADTIRTHEPAALQDACKVWSALRQSRKN